MEVRILPGVFTHRLRQGNNAFYGLLRFWFPPKPLPTVLFRQQAANEAAGSVLWQNDCLVAISAYCLVIRQDAEKKVGDASRLDLVGLRECVLHIRVRDCLCRWIRPLEVAQAFDAIGSMCLLKHWSQLMGAGHFTEISRLTTWQKQHYKR